MDPKPDCIICGNDLLQHFFGEWNLSKEILLLKHVNYGVSVLTIDAMYEYHYTFSISRSLWRVPGLHCFISSEIGV